jgi:DTW domain-containing protein YfiP
MVGIKKSFQPKLLFKACSTIHFENAKYSSYKLRGNQPKGGLCTIECIIEVLRIKGQHKLASELALKFDLFNG